MANTINVSAYNSKKTGVSNAVRSALADKVAPLLTDFERIGNKAVFFKEYTDKDGVVVYTSVKVTTSLKDPRLIKENISHPRVSKAKASKPEPEKVEIIID